MGAMKQPEYVDIERADKRALEIWRFDRAGDVVYYAKWVRWFAWQRFWKREEWNKTLPPRVPVEVALEARMRIEHGPRIFAEYCTANERPTEITVPGRPISYIKKGS
jgi:hypothetical protein